MNSLNTATALRAAGLAVWAIVSGSHFAAVSCECESLQSPGAARFYAIESGIALLLLGYAVCLWINLHDALVERSTRGHVFRLAVQAAAGMLVHTDLLFVVAAQAALVLERQSALRWLAGQTAILMLWAALLWRLGRFDMLWRLGFFETLPAAPAAPQVLAFSVTLLTVLIWQAFAFCAGWLAAGEARQRRAVARLNAELQLAQQALAEQSRLEERLHISRELHDSLGHHLVALNLQLDLAQRVPDAKRQDHVNAAAGLSRGMLGEVRRVVGALREEAPVDLQQA
jgi:signal transduction histidine kinase